MKQRPAPGPGGLVVVDKSGGMTSHDVVARVRRLARTRKVGHAGTLDPMATGVLLLGTERATRLLGHLMLTEKEYRATVRLGMSTTTDDAEGEPTGGRAAAALEETAVRAAFATQQGEISQRPSSVSAIKVDGQRAYQRVRAGEDVDLPARMVVVHSLSVESLTPVAEFMDAEIVVRCSSGTYIRAIARDVGALLGVGGHLTSLRRTAVGAFDLSAAVRLEDVGEELPIMPIADAARRSFPSLDLADEQAREVRFGRPLALDLDLPTAVFAPDGTFLALYQSAGPGRSKPMAVFV